ncbi:MAG: glycosyltransferase family 2 protein [Clostridia bacterium]|nr:glycosyltransferase family 2 protein [Clostridia bacterium]
MEARPLLWIVVPCYNEEKVLPMTAPLFIRKLRELAEAGKISANSRVLFVNDGSKDRTWEIIRNLSAEHPECLGICQSRNRGHQNAVLAGLMEAKDRCDITISIDCDGQDDLDAMNEMVDKYLAGAEIVYGVRSERKTDTWFKRTTALGFYRLMKFMGAEVVYNHADYRLISAKVLQHFAEFEEVNIFLRGMVPLVGFPSDTVYYERSARLAGESHYPLRKMIALAFNGITSLSVKPITLITTFGIGFSILGVILMIWAIIQACLGNTVAGWTSTVCIICLLGGIQLISIGVLGQYIGKTYLEAKRRPRYIISARTWEPEARHWIEEGTQEPAKAPVIPQSPEEKMKKRRLRSGEDAQA